MSSLITPTISAAATPLLSAALGLVLLILLVLILVQHELASAAGPRWRTLARASRAPLGPLVVAVGIAIVNRVLAFV